MSTPEEISKMYLNKTLDWIVHFSTTNKDESGLTIKKYCVGLEEKLNNILSNPTLNLSHFADLNQKLETIYKYAHERFLYFSGADEEYPRQHADNLTRWTEIRSLFSNLKRLVQTK